MKNEDVGDVERIAAFVQLAMDEARVESERKCAALRARLADLETVLAHTVLGRDRAMARLATEYLRGFDDGVYFGRRVTHDVACPLAGDAPKEGKP
jgi:hypothetical protein